VVEIHRPPNSFFDEGLLSELAGAGLALDDDPEVRSVVLCSEGKHFGTGAQLGNMTALACPGPSPRWSGGSAPWNGCSR
jgi:enoyl-CoA hydratase/carnithine racemase